MYIHWVTWHFTTSKSDSKHKANIVSAIETALSMRFVANFFHVIFSYLSFIIHSFSDFSFKKRDYREFFGWCLSQSMLYRRKYWLAVVQDGWHWRQVIAIAEWHFYIVFVHFIPNSIFFFSSFQLEHFQRIHPIYKIHLHCANDFVIPISKSIVSGVEVNENVSVIRKNSDNCSAKNWRKMQLNETLT